MKNSTRFINPRTDFGFKKLFGPESNGEALTSLLNALLEPEGLHIASITYLPTELQGETEERKTTFFDVHCVDKDGRQFIVEIQRRYHLHFEDRLVFYATHPTRQQSKKGAWRYDLAPVFIIAFLEFNLPGSRRPAPVSRARLRYDETFEVFSKNQTYILVEIPKFRLKEEKLATLLDKWLFLIRKLERIARVPPNMQERPIMKFLEDAELAALSEPERYRYERSLKIYRDNLLMEYSDEQLRLEAIAKAEAKAEAKGMAKGMAEGVSKGQQEEKYKTARNLLDLGFDEAVITQATGLSAETIAVLKTRP
jgi:predicted transposase/invertase (TIGR01784 family)